MDNGDGALLRLDAVHVSYGALRKLAPQADRNRPIRWQWSAPIPVTRAFLSSLSGVSAVSTLFPNVCVHVVSNQALGQARSTATSSAWEANARRSSTSPP
jgi:hypothetical protein